VRDNTSEAKAPEVRWEVLKSMLDSFPQLWNRTEEYIVIKRHETLIKNRNTNVIGIEELMRQAVMEYNQEQLKK
jgi:hypothetical protein